MAGLKQRRNLDVKASKESFDSVSKLIPTDTDEANSLSAGSENSSSLSTSANATSSEIIDNNNNNNNNKSKQYDRQSSSSTSLDNLKYFENGKGKSFKDRSQIPPSFYVVLVTTIGLHYFSGIYSMSTIESYKNSIVTSAVATTNLLQYVKDLAMTLIVGNENSTVIPNGTDTASMNMEYARVGIMVAISLSLFYVFFVAPFLAGFWTGKRTRKAVLHRYMGLAYLIQYTFAWVEFFTNYHPYRATYLCHFVAVNGKLRCHIHTFICDCFVGLYVCISLENLLQYDDNSF
jgi:hypothetical protein